MSSKAGLRNINRMDSEPNFKRMKSPIKPLPLDSRKQLDLIRKDAASLTPQ